MCGEPELSRPPAIFQTYSKQESRAESREEENERRAWNRDSLREAILPARAAADSLDGLAAKGKPGRALLDKFRRFYLESLTWRFRANGEGTVCTWQFHS
jgi:hypothetical protein